MKAVLVASALILGVAPFIGVPAAQAAALTVVAQNPSDGGGPGAVIVTNPSGASADLPYHLVARIADADLAVDPAHVASVVADVEDGDVDSDVDQTITLARVGTTDTWEGSISVATMNSFDPGTGTVTFTATDAGANVGTDAVVTLFANLFETLEITSPANGAGAGFFDLDGDGTPETVISGVVDEDLDNTVENPGEVVEAFYSTSAAATDPPVWVDCDTNDDLALVDNADTPDTFSLTCELQGTDTAEAVTMVAVRVDDLNDATPTPNELGEETGDAHRVSGFLASAVLAINDVTVVEGDAGTANAVFTVTRTGDTTAAAGATFATSDGTATAGPDYTTTTGTVSFAANDTSETITVPVIGDTAVEDDETFTVTLSNPTPASTALADGTGIGTITNDDSALSVNDVSVAEGDAGTSNATFTVTRSGDTTGTASATFATSDGTATVGSDYTAATDTVSFAANATTATITVPVLGDTAVEANETFTVTLSAPTGTTLGDATGIGTITNDDSSLSIDDVSVTEGNSGTTNAVFTVTRTGDTTGTASATFATSDGTATAGSDYTNTSGTVSFAAGDATATITVPVTGDTADEPNETFNVTLSDPAGTTLDDDTGAGTIADDDGGLSIDDVSVVEGDTGNTDATFTVTRTGDTTGAASATFTTSDGTATAGSDYTAATDTVSFAAGDATETISVVVTGDTVAEPNETFNVTLSDPVDTTLNNDTGVGTITDDDGALSVNDVSVAEGDAGTSNATFTVTRSGDTTGTASATFTTSDGTATAGSDYTATTDTSDTVSFAAGEATATITVPVTGDTVVEPDETFTLTLSEPVGTNLGDATGIGTI
ncbi:MAG: hypothetical protein M3P85_06005, partial [Actinomycetota bacterium]|nr:hypothetical protein [Actinomycetota bacterium]